MSNDVRQRMVEGATQVLSRRGLQATSFAEVLALTGASRGSIYHHFPGGKNELIEAVLDHFSARITGMLEAARGQPAVRVMETALASWRALLSGSNCDAGCPAAAVALAADSSRVQDQARQAFDCWEQTLIQLMVIGGLPEAQSRSFSTFLLAAIEGAMVLCRAQGRIEPFDTVAAQLRTHFDLLHAGAAQRR